MRIVLQLDKNRFYCSTMDACNAIVYLHRHVITVCVFTAFLFYHFILCCWKWVYVWVFYWVQRVLFFNYLLIAWHFPIFSYSIYFLHFLCMKWSKYPFSVWWFYATDKHTASKSTGIEKQHQHHLQPVTTDKVEIELMANDW